MKLKLTALALLTAAAFNANATTDVMIAYGNQPGEPIDLAIKHWAELVNEKSNGEINFKLFPSSQLGSETEVLEQAKFGATS